jgi:hypothetical protein
MRCAMARNKTGNTSALLSAGHPRLRGSQWNEKAVDQVGASENSTLGPRGERLDQRKLAAT